MATFTITSDTNIDLLTTKTGGDTYTINGAVLTIDSDTRWAKNATPTTGPFGNMTISSTLGGSIVIDGTKVWLLPYDNGAGVVPATGDTITGAGGATGELIGVWTAINTTPTAAGAAMPATGFIKLKDKTTTFSDNEALTGTGMTADVNSSTGGYRGWLEIVGQEVGNMNVPRLGDATFTGDWFYLDNTTGTPGQILQAPNSGGTNTYWPGVFIETGVGTNEYEIYPAINRANVTGTSPWNNTQMGTDARCKFVESMSSGRFRIGTDGTNNVGYTPVSGCRVRIPNILLQNTTSADRSVNVIPHSTQATRYDFNLANAGDIIFSKVMGAWYPVFTQAYSCSLVDFLFFDSMQVTECATQLIMTNVANGNYGHYDVNSAQISTNNAGAVITDCKFGRTGFCASSDYHLYVLQSRDVVVNGGIFGPRSPLGNSASFALYFVNSYNGTFNDVTLIGNRLQITDSSDVVINNLVYANNYVGTTTTSFGVYAVSIGTTANVTIDGISFFPGISNTHPYLGVVNPTAGCSNLIVRNVGTYASPLDLGTVNPSQYFIRSGGITNNVAIKRVYVTNIGVNLWLNVNSDDGWVFENVFGDYADTPVFLAANAQAKGCGNTWNPTGQVAVYGSHFYDVFDSTTTGKVGLAFNEKTTDEPSASTYTISGGTPKFTSTGNLKMDGLTDEIIYEMQYFAIGHTGFQNVAPTLAGTSTGNMTYEYDININDGNGFTGSYKALTGANLSAETIDATLGFKLRIKISTNTASSTTLLNNLYVSTTSTTTTQAYQYPLTSYSVTFSGLQTGTVIAVLETGTENLLAKLTETAGVAVYTFNADDAGNGVDYAILAPGYNYQLYENQILVEEDTDFPVFQTVDYIYDASASADVTFDGVTKLAVSTSNELDLIGMYSDYIDWQLTATNLKYFVGFTGIGGSVIEGSKSIPAYIYQANGWKNRPQEASGTLNVINGVLVGEAGADPFVDTLGAYTVRINYEQPVQAITVATSGSSITPADVADAVWDEVLSGHTTAGTTGKKLKDNLTQNNFFGLK